jgi:lipopolysaccharide export system protein LptA
MRLTIERMRTLVLFAGVLLVVALVSFLAIGKWKSPLNRRDLPKHLGINVQQEANGFTHAEFRAGHALFKITASKVEQLKDDRYRLHSVKIEMYGNNGGGMDSIAGNEFEYDQRSGIAHAEGPVEITLARPPGTAGKSGSKSSRSDAASSPGGPSQSPLAGEIQVKTSGLTFDQHSGIATTARPVEFQLAQSSGSAVGASYDSQSGTLVLERDVQLNTFRGSDPVSLSARHAEFEQADQVCQLNFVVAKYRAGDAQAGRATIRLRDDGSAEELDAAGGLTLNRMEQGRLSAPAGSLFFDKDNHPAHGHLEGGVSIDSESESRQLHGTSPTADLGFTASGVLSRAHLERGVRISSIEQANSSRTERTWVSPVADLEFRQSAGGQIELSRIHGTGGVVITAESQRGSGTPSPSRMAADDVTGVFGPNSTLASLTGLGRASIVQTTPNGTQQSTSGDRLEAHLASTSLAVAANARGSGAQVGSATVDGNVVLVQQAPTRAGTLPPPTLRATAQRAAYEGAGEWLHLTGAPRVEDGGLQLSADKIDFSQTSGDAFARGDVKATWFGNQTGNKGNEPERQSADSSHSMPALGTQGPAHVVAAEAQLQQRTGEATFRGDARLWQQGNSVVAPLIVLNRIRQTLVAQGAPPADPVKVVLVAPSAQPSGKAGALERPSVIRVRGGDLKYSDAERKAVMHGGASGTVIAETATATTHSNEVELTLLPPGNHAARDGAAAQVDRMTARGGVSISSMGRQGTGDQLVYSGESGEYTLTGSPAAPPRLTDPVRGTVTGEALIFNSRDDSVNVEGGSRQTVTETTVPKRP